MVTVLALLGILVVLFVAGVLSTREGPLMADVPQDAADLDLPEGPLQPEDVAAVRFGMAPRGYRMSEVDAVLERLAAELADRDRRLALFDAEVQGVTSTDPLPGTAEATSADLPLPSGPVTTAPVWGPPAGPPQEVAEVREQVAPLPTAPVPADPAPGLLAPPSPPQPLDASGGDPSDEPRH